MSSKPSRYRDISSSDFSEESDYSTGYNVYKNGSTNNNNLLSTNDHQDNILHDNIFTTPQRNHIGIDDKDGMSIQEDMIDLSISNNDDGIGGRSTFGRRSSFDNIDVQQQSSLQQQQQQPFTSKLGRRIWEQYCTQSISQSPQRHIQNSQSAIPSFQQLPSMDFLKLPTSIIQIYKEVIPSSSNDDDNNKKNDTTTTTEWINIEELEQRVMQHHLDLEAVELTTSSSASSSLLLDDNSPSSSQTNKPSSNRSATHEKFNNFNPNSGIRSSISSSLITSECFTKVINRHTSIGLGMSLRIYNGCVYIHSLLRLDGTRIDCYNGRNESCDRISFVQHDVTSANGTNGNSGGGSGGGPAANVGLLPGDRLLGLNGLPFLKGKLATTTTTDIDINNNDRTTLKITGSAKIKQQSKQPSDEEILKSVGELISISKSPMAVHIQRVEDYREWILDLLNKSHRESLRKKKQQSNGIGLQNPKRMSSSSTTKLKKKRGPKIHPFAKALSQRLIIKSTEEILISRQLQIFTDRTRQWESKLSFQLSSSVNGTYTLRPMLDVRDVEPTYYSSFIMDDKECPTYFDYKGSKSIRNYAPSTPMIEDWRRRRLEHEGDNDGSGMILSSPPRRVSQRISKEVAIMIDLYDGLDDNDRYVQDLILDNDQGSSSYSSKLLKAMSTTDPSDVYVPLIGVRKALCIRILNTFLDSKNRTAFTIWCYDVESGLEWYAPVRYYTDFKDLRSALIRVDKSIGDIPFPTIGSSWLSFSSSSEAKESPKVKETRRNQLEIFLRRVFASVYRGRLHPYIAEIAVHLQTFVGCDTVLNDDDGVGNEQVAISEVTYGKRDRSSKLNSEPEDNARLHLKRSIMRYVYRLFLLPSVGELVGHFIDAARDKVMSESMVPTTRQSHQFSVDKKEATDNVGKIRDFIDQVQELILEGCMDDFISISQRRDFAAFVDDPDNIARDELFREAVREQTELEIYVPLRSTISKYLVYAWFNEDMELKHKTKVCIYVSLCLFVSWLPMLDVCSSILTKHLLLNLYAGFREQASILL